MRRYVPLLLVSGVLAHSVAASARETPREELARAIQLFENFQDDAAAFALHDLLHHAPSAEVAAKAHIYLALILLNAADAAAAKVEMQKAVSTDVMVDLPLGQSPKAQVLFAQARRELTTVGPSAPGVTPAPTPESALAPPGREHGMEGMLPVEGAPATGATAAPGGEAPRSHALRWTFLGVGIVAAAVAVVGAVEVVNYTNLDGQLQKQQIPAGLTYQSAKNQQSAAGTWGTVGLVLGGVAAACVVGMAVAW
jgi:hypothetical protein